MKTYEGRQLQGLFDVALAMTLSQAALELERQVPDALICDYHLDRGMTAEVSE